MATYVIEFDINFSIDNYGTEIIRVQVGPNLMFYNHINILGEIIFNIVFVCIAIHGPSMTGFWSPLY